MNLNFLTQGNCPPIYLYLIFWNLYFTKLILNLISNLIFFLFQTWFLLPVEPAKIEFEINKKSSSTNSKRILTSKCDICILELILTFFVLQNSWHFWTIVGSILFVLQNSCHFQTIEAYGRIYFICIFLEFFWNSFGILLEFSIFKVSGLFTLLKSADYLHC